MIGISEKLTLLTKPTIEDYSMMFTALLHPALIKGYLLSNIFVKKCFGLATSYSRRVNPTTIGAEELNFCVRYGNRCDLFAIVTKPRIYKIDIP